MLPFSTFSLACHHLEQAGFQVYTHINPGQSTFVIETPEEGFCKVRFRTASKSGKTHILTLSTKNQTEHFVSSIQFFLIASGENQTVWLIPIHQIPKHTKSIRLGSRYDKFIIKPSEDMKGVEEKKLREVVTERLFQTKGEIKQESLEYLLSL